MYEFTHTPINPSSRVTLFPHIYSLLRRHDHSLSHFIRSHFVTHCHTSSGHALLSHIIITPLRYCSALLKLWADHRDKLAPLGSLDMVIVE